MPDESDEVEPPSPDRLVQFIGPFDEAERVQLHRAIDRVEQIGALPEWPHGTGKPWIVTKQSNGKGAAMVAAIRVGTKMDVRFVGDDTDMVVAKIEAWLDRNQDGSNTP